MLAVSPMIELASVTKQFDGKRDVVALDHVTLMIPRGEMPAPNNPDRRRRNVVIR